MGRMGTRLVQGKKQEMLICTHQARGRTMERGRTEPREDEVKHPDLDLEWRKQRGTRAAEEQ